MIVPAAHATAWPVAGGAASRSSTQPVEPGALPALAAWAIGGESVRTPAIVTEGSSPSEQRVAYGTGDGRIHVRLLTGGADVTTPVPIVDSPVTDPATTFGSGIALVSGSGALFAVHNDGAGVDIARLDARTGTRLGPDVAIPDSLGCVVAGSPLLTPPASDGSRLLFFTMNGGCTRGPSLVRVPVGADAGLGAVTSAATVGLQADVAPALIVLGSPPQFVVAVARTGGIDLRRADGDFAQPPYATVNLGEDPAAFAAPDTAPSPTSALVVLTRGGEGTRVVRLDQAADGTLRAGPARALTGTPAGVALAGTTDPLLVVSTTAAVSVLRSGDLGVVGTAPGGAGPVSASGDLAFAVRSGRLLALRLNDASVADLAGAAGSGHAPALARGFVTLGPVAVRTTDVTSPAVSMPADARGLVLLSAIASDDRGIASVQWRLGGRSLRSATEPAHGSSFEPGARYEARYDPRRVAPGSYTLAAVARDTTGNAGRARRPVKIPCERVRRGGRRSDKLRGRRRRDCLYGGAGADRLLVRGGGADAVDCGPGRDLVRADRFDRVSDDCERVRP